MKRVLKKIIPKLLWNKIRLWRLKLSVKLYRPKIVRRNYGGHLLDVKICDPLGQGWYDRDWARLLEIEFLSKGRLIQGARVFDFGAHQGIVAMMLAKEVGPQGQVVALEANKHNHSVLRANTILNRFENIISIHGALGERSGTLEFSESLNGAVDNGTGAWGKVSISAFTVDEIAERYGKPDVIFLDIEGFEYLALKGAKKMLERPIDWFIEVHGPQALAQYGGSAQGVLAYFPEEKFDCFISSGESDFCPLDNQSGWLTERFYLIARNKGI